MLAPSNETDNHGGAKRQHLGADATLTSPCGAVFSAELSEGGKFDVLKPRLLFILIQLGGLAFGLWKLAGMGLLPTHASDFVSTLSIPKALERSVPAIPFQ